MGKIKMCCPFYNENTVANLNIKEASKWVDEIHITECNKSFKYGDHDYCFLLEEPEKKVFYHKIDGNEKYIKPRTKHFYVPPHFFLRPISRWMKHYCYSTAWYNEGVSRNYSLWNIEYNDDDIIILSDIDEILDSSFADYIISETKKSGIVTVKLYYTMFYLNLFCKNWPGPEDYSYRTFVVRGDVLRKNYYNDSDYLRKLGEHGKLFDSVICLDGFKGFHHSWLGDERFVANKILSYAHSLGNHSTDIVSNGRPDVEAIKKKISDKESIFPNTSLEIDNNITLLPYVEEMRKSFSSLFI